MGRQANAGKADMAEKPDERLKKWYLIQMAGGVPVIIGILLATYAIATAKGTNTSPELVLPIILAIVGFAVHIFGRIGARRLR
jgi:hypothetical protein